MDGVGGVRGSRVRVGIADGALAAGTLLIVAAATLGGASRENAGALALVELAALPAAVIGLAALISRRQAPAWPLVVLAFIVAIPLLQLVPMPPAMWRSLPAAGARIEALRLAGLPQGWLPLSLARGETAAAAMALLPPAAMFVVATGLRGRERKTLTAVWIAVAMAGFVLGAFQIAAPAGGPYLYPTTNRGSLVGFFANRNHEASMLLALLPLAAAVWSSAREGPA
ncbi:MAG: hypothetical protein ABI242_01115, partial [Caulobacteraceae bacterium]